MPRCTATSAQPELMMPVPPMNRTRMSMDLHEAAAV
jgi:hypothetical protein